MAYSCFDLKWKFLLKSWRQAPAKAGPRKWRDGELQRLNKRVISMSYSALKKSSVAASAHYFKNNGHFWRVYRIKTISTMAFSFYSCK